MLAVELLIPITTAPHRQSDCAVVYYTYYHCSTSAVGLPSVYVIPIYTVYVIAAHTYYHCFTSAVGLPSCAKY